MRETSRAGKVRGEGGWADRERQRQRDTQRDRQRDREWSEELRTQRKLERKNEGETERGTQGGENRDGESHRRKAKTEIHKETGEKTQWGNREKMRETERNWYPPCHPIRNSISTKYVTLRRARRKATVPLS